MRLPLESTAGNEIFASGIQQNIERFKGRIFYNRNDGAFVRVSVFTRENGIKEANLLTNPLLKKYWT